MRDENEETREQLEEITKLYLQTKQENEMMRQNRPEGKVDSRLVEKQVARMVQK